ncbi:phosphoglycerate mutase family protein [Raoultella scottii]|uniref:phosphoglycerate mutase family protein n=1 Tax=Raoultella scottii TaxID=3040937 RepID=UPI002FA40129
MSFYSAEHIKRIIYYDRNRHMKTIINVILPPLISLPDDANMDITLIRHGKPDGVKNRGLLWLKASEMPAWIADYNAATVAEMPSPKTKSACEAGDYFVCSPLPRALSSLSALGVNPDAILRDLSEAPLPVINVALIKFPAGIWLMLFRLLWFFDLAAGSESKAEVRARAAKMARDLIDTAAQHGHVVSMGHGLLNTFIALELTRLGWIKIAGTGSGYWSRVTYRSPR